MISPGTYQYLPIIKAGDRKGEDVRFPRNYRQSFTSGVEYQVRDFGILWKKAMTSENCCGLRFYSHGIRKIKQVGGLNHVDWAG
jgi:hypothetical protein